MTWIWKLSLLLGILFLTLPSLQGATVKGTVYNESLQNVDSAVVTINTTPEQRVVSKNGAYKFDVPNKGKYVLTATYADAISSYRTEKDIAIKDEGDYTIDLILTPDNQTQIKTNATQPALPEEPKSSFSWILFLIFFVILAGGGYIGWRYARYTSQKSALPPVVQSEQDLEREQVLKYIQDHQRINQKDLRKAFPGFSEAKISLIISELELRNHIQKIKKGRGNIILIK